MTGHDHFRRLAAWAIDQPLSDVDAREAQRRRAGCDACRSFDDDLRADALAMSRQRELWPGWAIDRRVETALYGARGRGLSNFERTVLQRDAEFALTVLHPDYVLAPIVRSHA